MSMVDNPMSFEYTGPDEADEDDWDEQYERARDREEIK